MTQSNPQFDLYLPTWTTARFVIMDATERWASAIRREALQQMQLSEGVRTWIPVFEICNSARDALMLCEMRNTAGLVLFAELRERECLSALGGLLRRQQTLPVLLVCEDHHEELVPVLMEAGVDAVLYNVRSDVSIGKWCARVLQRSRVT